MEISAKIITSIPASPKTYLFIDVRVSGVCKNEQRNVLFNILNG